MNDKFVTQWFNVEDLELCFSVIDKIRDNCIMKVHAVDYVSETEDCKCVTGDDVTEIIHPINNDDISLPPLPPVINLSSIRYPR